MTVLIVSCHPDDMEFMMAGTALLLRDAGCAVHHINVANGSVGSVDLRPEEITAVRWKEATRSAALLGSVPVAVIYSFFVDYYVSSLTGAVKE